MLAISPQNVRQPLTHRRTGRTSSGSFQSYRSQQLQSTNQSTSNANGAPSGLGAPSASKIVIQQLERPLNPEVKLHDYLMNIVLKNPHQHEEAVRALNHTWFTHDQMGLQMLTPSQRPITPNIRNYHSQKRTQAKEPTLKPSLSQHASLLKSSLRVMHSSMFPRRRPLTSKSPPAKATQNTHSSVLNIKAEDPILTFRSQMSSSDSNSPAYSNRTLLHSYRGKGSLAREQLLWTARKTERSQRKTTSGRNQQVLNVNVLNQVFAAGCLQAKKAVLYILQ